MNFQRLYNKTFAATLALSFTAPSYAVVYSYDKLHRLTTVKHNSGQVIHYTYESVCTDIFFSTQSSRRGTEGHRE